MQNMHLRSQSAMSVKDSPRDMSMLATKKLQNLDCKNRNCHDDDIIETKINIGNQVSHEDLTGKVVNSLYNCMITEEAHRVQSFYWKPGEINNNTIQLYHEPTPLQVSSEEVECTASNLQVIDLHVPECYDKIEISYVEDANNILNLTFKAQSPQQDSLPSSSIGQLNAVQEFSPKKSADNKTEYNVDRRISQNLTILENEIRQKRKQLKCQCPNCSAEDGIKMRGSNGRSLHVCHKPNCRKVFTKTNYLTKHLERHNVKKNLCFNSERKYVCHVTYCGKAFLHSDHLRKHLKLHSGIKDSIYSYNETWYLKKNVALHSDEKNFICAHCNKGFADKDTMKNHIEEHIHLFQKKLKKYKVDSQVSQNFIIPQLQSPEKSSRKKCQCPYCSTGDKQIRDAAGKLLYTCCIADCKRVFCSVASLKRHLKRNHSLNHHSKRHIIGKQDKCQYENYNGDGRNPIKGPDSSALHVCRHCKKIFARSADLEDHLEWYSSKENFFCAHCPKGYSHKRALAFHVRIHMACQVK